MNDIKELLKQHDYLITEILQKNYDLEKLILDIKNNISINNEIIKELIISSIQFYKNDCLLLIIEDTGRFNGYYKNHNHVVNILQVLNINKKNIIYLNYFNNLDKEHNHSNNGIYLTKLITEEEIMTIIKHEYYKRKFI